MTANEQYAIDHARWVRLGDNDELWELQDAGWVRLEGELELARAAVDYGC